MKKYITKIMTVATLTLIYSGCATSYTNVNELKKATHIKNKCIQPDDSKSAWYIGNLYDCKTNSFFIPYQLWSGAEYDGDKANSINHQVDKHTLTPHERRGKIRYSSLHIKGTSLWKNTRTGNDNKIYIRTRSKNNKIQYFVANHMGIGRVYDSRYGIYSENSQGIKFPAGYGWQLNKPRSLGRTKIEIISINTTSDNELDSIQFNWWTRGILDHSYIYEKNTGIINATREN